MLQLRGEKGRGHTDVSGTNAANVADLNGSNVCLADSASIAARVLLRNTQRCHCVNLDRVHGSNRLENRAKGKTSIWRRRSSGLILEETLL